MKDIVVNKINFFELVKKRDFRLPLFQREYSWDEENWEEFIQSITNFIDNKDLSEKKSNELQLTEDEEFISENGNQEWNINQEEYFAGDIILQKGNKKNSFCKIIDGQQRLVTIFILLYAIYERMGDQEEEKRTKQNIEKILFLKSKEKKIRIRINLNNLNDKQEFGEALNFLQNIRPEKKRGRKKKLGNISKAKDYFIKFLEKEVDYNLYEIYNTIKEDFYFALVEIQSDDKVQELFTALNNTGLNLSNSDLLKSLLIEKIKIKEFSKNEVNKTWEEKIVGVITDASKRQTINREMDRFLIDFWLAKFGESENIGKNKPTKPTKLSIYNLFEHKITDSNKAYEILNSLTDYAEVYKYIKDPDNLWWKETSWPMDMFYIVSDISLLSHSQLFPVILKVHFEFDEKSSEKKRESVMKELKIALLFMFRWVTVKGKSPGDIPRFVPSILEEISTNKRLFSDDLKKKWLEHEFNKEGREKFYNEFSNYTTRKNRIWEFVLRNYYWRKYKTKFRFEKLVDFRKTMYTWKTVSVEHLIPQNPSAEHKLNSEDVGENIVYSLGNVTLMEGKLNTKLANDVWKKKKIRIKNRGNDCPLNLEESPLFDLEKLTSESIKNRTKSLINEFKKNEMKLFDVSWVSKGLSKEDDERSK